MHKFQLLGSRSAPLYYFVLPRDCNFDLFRSGNSMEDSSPLREESGCGAGIFHLSSSSSLGGGSAGSPTSPSTTPFNKTVRLLVGSKHHFDLVKIHLGPPNVSSDTMRILALASGSSFGAISATEVRFFRKLMPHNWLSGGLWFNVWLIKIDYGKVYEGQLGKASKAPVSKQRRQSHLSHKV